MCYSLRESIFAFTLLVFVTILLYIRNTGYDRLFAPLMFIVSLIQLIELFVFLQLDTKTAGRFIFLILWLQVLVLAISLYLFFQTTLTLLFLLFFAFVFFYAVYDSTISVFSAEKGTSKHIEWRRNGGSILGSAGILYLIGIFLPFLIVEYYENWSNIGIWILLLLVILSAVVVYFFFPGIAFASLWCYSAVFIVFSMWMISAFTCSDC